jgi:superfamily II DNA or RNA helicase
MQHPAIERIKRELETKDYLQQLYPHQKKAYLEIAEAFVTGSKAPVFQAVTGYGKSQLARAIVRSTYERMMKNDPNNIRSKILWLGKNDHILTNAYEHLLGVGLPANDIGIIKAYKSASKYPFEPAKRIQIASIQTLQSCWNDWKARGLLYMMDFQFIVIDECHNFCNRSKLYSGIIEHYPNVRKLGLTATPYHKAGLNENFDSLILSLTQKELAHMGYQPFWEVFGTESPVDRKSLAVGADGEYTQKAAKKAADAIATKHGDIVKSWLQHVGDRYGHVPTILFAESIQHSKDYCQYINDAQLVVNGKPLKAVHIDGTMKSWEMDKVFEAILTREATILCNCAKFLEGLDLATVAESRGFPKLAFGVVQDLTFVNSINRHKQKVGRARGFYWEGKLIAIYLDHVGASEEHGDPDTVYEWSLDGTPKKAPGEKPVKLCPPEDRGCGKFIPRFLMQCPHCGYNGFPKQLEEELKPEDLHDKETELVRLERTNLDRFMFMHKTQETKGWAIGEFVKYAPTYQEMLQACKIADYDCSLALQRWVEGQRIALQSYDWLPEFETVLDILSKLRELSEQKAWKKAKKAKPLQTYETWLKLVRSIKGQSWKPSMQELLAIEKTAKFKNTWAWSESQQLLKPRKWA